MKPFKLEQVADRLQILSEMEEVRRMINDPQTLTEALVAVHVEELGRKLADDLRAYAEAKARSQFTG